MSVNKYVIQIALLTYLFWEQNIIMFFFFFINTSKKYGMQFFLLFWGCVRFFAYSISGSLRIAWFMPITDLLTLDPKHLPIFLLLAHNFWKSCSKPSTQSVARTPHFQPWGKRSLNSKVTTAQAFEAYASYSGDGVLLRHSILKYQ